mmetsp:Transcript_47847/g.84860  ORF Transcript_47847/g.84860 Transcript_47847/m.84860 type:complete len:479 (-) Transcript_47847:154-1590(-)
MPAKLEKIFGGVDAYRILGCSRDSTDEELKQAYRNLALKHHPDKAKAEDHREATERFQEIQAAYEAVNPANRKHYDLGIGGLVLDTGKTDLMAACEAGDVARVKKLIESSADVLERDSTGRTALMFAAGAASVEVLHVLLQSSADIEARNCAGHSCLMFAVGAGIPLDSAAHVHRALLHLEAVRFLLDEGAPVDAATCYGLTPLMLACASGRLNMIQLLLARGADARAQSDIGLTALVMAADKGNAEAVECILAAAADANHRFGEGRTPLMGAAAQAHTRVVEKLLSGRADVNAVSKEGQTPLLFAVEKGLKDGLVCPIKGAVVQKPDAEATVDFLLQAQADPNLAGPKRRTPLHVACAGGSAGLVDRLISGGADLQALDEEGRRPADIASKQGHTEILIMLDTFEGAAYSGSGGEYNASPNGRSDEGLRTGKPMVTPDMLVAGQSACPWASSSKRPTDLDSQGGCFKFWHKILHLCS